MDMYFDGLSALHFWGLSLRRCMITPARRKRSLVNILCSDASLDLLRGQEPCYESRTVTAEFDPVGQNAATVIARLEDELEGRQVTITLPNDEPFYMIGDIHISSAGLASGNPVTICAECNPWRYRRDMTVHTVPAAAVPIEVELRNAGRRSVVPEMIVASDVTVSGNGLPEKRYVAGTYLLPDFQIPGHRSVTITVTGGPVEIRYQEAML